MKRTLRVYLADLTHDTVVLVSDTIPINIGFIGAYAKKIFNNQISIELFKYPSDLISSLKKSPPDVLALSNYSWNSNLSEGIARLAKKISPSTIVVQGGPNFPTDEVQQRDFMSRRPSTDIYIELEAEISFSNLLGRIIEGNFSLEKNTSPIEGCVYLEKAGELPANQRLVRGPLPDRIRDLDEIPSPYLNGMLDKFFDGRLRPFIETNRGCPFDCSFCHTGNKYFRKMNMFSVDRVAEEIDYIGRRISKTGVAGLHIADTNFGMFPRDREICVALKNSHEKYGWPEQVIATTGKNNKERVMDITSIMGNTFNVNMSVQSMDEGVLRNIKRSNIKLEDYVQVASHLKREGRPGFGELILGLPGETRESFIRGLQQVIEADVSAVTIYTLMLLHGTEFQNPSYRKEYEMISKFRIVPLNFGKYDGELVFDYEEVCVQTRDMTFEDYVYLRGLSLIVESLHNGRPYEELFRYGLNVGLSRSQLLLKTYEALPEAPQRLRNFVAEFVRETREELWDTEEELIEHYKNPINYGVLKSGEAGGNLLQKYKAIGLANYHCDWIQHIADTIRNHVNAQVPPKVDAGTLDAELSALTEFCTAKLIGLLDERGDTGPVRLLCAYNIGAWLADSDKGCLREHLLVKPKVYRFLYTPEQLRVRDEYFKRYGTDANGLSKIVTRISSLESVIRKIHSDDGDINLYLNTDRNLSTRYVMAT